MRKRRRIEGLRVLARIWCQVVVTVRPVCSSTGLSGPRDELLAGQASWLPVEQGQICLGSSDLPGYLSVTGYKRVSGFSCKLWSAIGCYMKYHSDLDQCLIALQPLFRWWTFSWYGGEIFTPPILDLVWGCNLSAVQNKILAVMARKGLHFVCNI